MDVKTVSVEELLKIVHFYNHEQQHTNITKLDNKGRLLCSDKHRSPHSHQESFLAWDELMKRGMLEKHKSIMNNYTRSKRRYDDWHGILCGRIIQHIVMNNDGTLPANLIHAANK
jgi:hypothetical protein